MKVWRELNRMLGSARWEYAAVIASSCFIAAVEGICHPLLVKAIFDNVATVRSGQRFAWLIGGYLVLGLFSNAAGTANALWTKNLGNRLAHSLSQKLLTAYYRSDYSAVLKNGSGYYISRIHGDVREGVLPLLTLVDSIAVQAVMLVSFSAVLCYLSWKAFALLLALIPISAVAGQVIGKRITALSTEEREQEGAFLAILEKALSAFRMVQSFSLRTATVGRFDERLQQCLDTGYRRFKLTRLFQSLNDLTMNVSDFATMLVGAYFVMKGALSFGGFMAFINTFWRALTTLLQLFNQLAEFRALAAVSRRVLEFTSATTEEKTPYFTTGRGISLEGVSVSYDGEMPVLSDIRFELRPSERVVLVGRNGSGKTTLANLLSGHFAPDNGTVTLPARISSITLPVVFPPLSIGELVADAALRGRLGLGDLPAETAADELSAGQQQKLALALALSSDADLYVIDEPLASLDNESRRVAIDLILERTAGKSVILIMHGYEEFYPFFDRVLPLETLKAPALCVA